MLLGIYVTGGNNFVVKQDRTRSTEKKVQTENISLKKLLVLNYITP